MWSTTRRLARVWFFAALTLWGSSWPAEARADTTETERARASWIGGQALFNQGKYQEAMALFAEGYALSHRPAFLFNMAECARLLDDRPLAHRLYLRYLTYHPESHGREKAKQRCLELGVGPCTPAAAKPERRRSPSGGGPPATGGKVHAPAGEPDLGRGRGLEPRPSSALEPGFRPRIPLSEEIPRERPRAFYKRWPLWLGVGLVVVAGGVTAAILATRSQERSVPPGDRYLDLGQ